MRRSTISVIVPCFNMAKYLPETLDCVLSQSRKPDEVLVLDREAVRFEFVRSVRRAAGLT